MNKILLNKNLDYQLDNSITIEYKEDFINKLDLKILKSTKLELIIDEIDKLDINIEIDKDIVLELVEIKKNNKFKILSKYILNENSVLNLTKINDLDTINERNYISLDGINSKLNLVLKTISKSLEKYDFIINHNYSNTISDITTHGINLSGNLYFNINTHVLNDRKNCIANQNNRIINLTANECMIRPNLLIDEVDVEANHSALIGNFKEDELFYIQRLGLDKEKATKLLIEGFLKSKIDEEYANILKKYWR